ncbi:hypothetical protein [Aeromonas enteropelogenes]|uniref:hypothetical protein n=1 Tax=Aeromonas enteropelogenes TaxID=29489 RepID=UPI003BA016A5
MRFMIFHAGWQRKQNSDNPPQMHLFSMLNGGVLHDSQLFYELIKLSVGGWLKIDQSN